MEELKAMYPVCTLIKSDGIRCGSPAVTGMNFCFHHIGGRLVKSSPETPVDSTPLKFVYPDSHAAIQHNLFLVVQALNEGKIDNRTANTYNRLFRACELNLRKCEAANTGIRLKEQESVQKADESVQQAADPDPDPEADTDPDVEPEQEQEPDPGDDSVAENPAPLPRMAAVPARTSLHPDAPQTEPSSPIAGSRQRISQQPTGRPHHLSPELSALSY